MQKQSGFTLIELVIVIIILGILAATAVPKFIDLQSDARVSALKGVKAALEGGATLTYSKAAIEGIEKTSGTVNGVETAFGYPTVAGIFNAVDLSANDWASAAEGTNANKVRIYSADYSSAQATCNVIYDASVVTSTARPTITVTDSGC